MNLRAKKQLAANTLGVGKERILFVNERIEEIKEALTKEDIRQLKEDGAIIVKEIKGRKKVIKKKKKRGPGNIRKNVNRRKKDYVIMTRKLRKIVADRKRKGELVENEVKDLRKKIRNKMFRSEAHLKRYIGGKKDEKPKAKKKRK